MQRPSVRFAPEVPERTRALLFSPETSGGLLAAVPRGETEACLSRLRAAGVEAAVVGEADSSLPAGTISVD